MHSLMLSPRSDANADTDAGRSPRHDDLAWCSRIVDLAALAGQRQAAPDPAPR
jgi:hypothetical protein